MLHMIRETSLEPQGYNFQTKWATTILCCAIKAAGENFTWTFRRATHKTYRRYGQGKLSSRNDVTSGASAAPATGRRMHATKFKRELKKQS